MKTAEKLYSEIRFGTRIGFGKSPALILIDLMYGCTDPSFPIGFDQSAEIAQSRRLLEAFREKNLPVVFLTAGRTKGDIKGHMFVKKIPGVAETLAGSRAAEIDERVKPLETEPVVLKKSPSGFFSTNLHSLLTGLRVDTTILVGNSTSGCVRATAIDSICSNFHTILPVECVADRDPEVHKANLFDIDAKYADVVSVEEVLDYLKDIPKQID